MLRFRPILMTTMAALFGALPLAFGTGTGSELRRPLGITIVGGLIVSQMLTLYTTPVVYLFFDRMRLRFQGKRTATVQPWNRGGLLASALCLWSVRYEESIVQFRQEQPRASLRALYRLLLPAPLLAGCNVGPKYVPPPHDCAAGFQRVAQQFKEAEGLDCGAAAGRNSARQVVGDLQRSGTECARRATQHRQPEHSRAFENFMEARALVREARSQYFPHDGIGPSYTRSQSFITIKSRSGQAGINHGKWRPGST
jgi:hypothetical protein